MANTFLAAAGYDMQKSLVEEDRLDWARDFLSTDIAKEKLMLQIDLVAAISFSEDALHQVCSVDSLSLIHI